MIPALLVVDAWTDFTCPHSFLASLRLRRLRDELPLEIRWRSMLVRPPGLPPLSEKMRESVEEARATVGETIRREFGLTLYPGPLELDTLPAHLAVKHAERLGFADKCHEAIMRAYWLEKASIDSRPVLDELLRDSGTDGAGISWDDPALAEAVDADLGLAQALDLFFVPALRFGERTIVAGAEPYEHLHTAALAAAAALANPAGHTDVSRGAGPSAGGASAHP